MDASKRRFMNRGIRATRSRSRETQRGLCEMNQVAFRVVVNGRYGVYGVDRNQQKHGRITHKWPTYSNCIATCLIQGQRDPFPSLPWIHPLQGRPGLLHSASVVGRGAFFVHPKTKTRTVLAVRFFCLGEANCTKAVNHVVVVFTRR